MSNLRFRALLECLDTCKFEFFNFQMPNFGPKNRVFETSSKSGFRLLCSYRLPVHPDIFLFEIGQKMAELQNAYAQIWARAQN